MTESSRNIVEAAAVGAEAKKSTLAAAGTALGGRVRALLKGMARIDRIVAFALLIAAGVVRAIDPAPVEILRVNVFDFYQTVVPRRVEQYPVIVVDVDEESLAEIGQWPWPRTVLADLVTRLAKLGAAAIAFDVIFPEPDRMSPGRVAEALRGLDEETAAALRRLPGNDAAFAQVLKRARVVLGQSVKITPDAVPRPPLKTTVAEVGGDPRKHLLAGQKHVALVRNISVLEQAAAGRGIILQAAERDGIVRRVPAIIEVGGELYPTLAVELLRVATGQSAYAVRSSADGIASVVVAGVKIPTDPNGRFWVRFSPHDPKRFVSAKDVLSGAVPSARLKGKLVLVGTSASGLLDIRGTPFGMMPGVEIHAQLLENMLNKSILVRPADSIGIEIAIALAAGLLMILLLPLLGARWTAAFLVAVVAGAGATSWYLFTGEGIMIDVTYAAIVTFLIYSLLTYTSYTRAEAQRQEVRDAFGRYLSPTLVEQLAEDPSRLQLGGEDRYMTLLFADVQDFTTLSEQLDARTLTRLINRFFTPMTDAILKWNGTVDKYMGDCVMAFWNAPLDDARHARHACLAALDMQSRLAPLNQELRADAEAEGRPFIPIRVGIGLNSGDCMVGNMGSDQRFDYSVLGDTVNVASRLEGLSRVYRVGIVLGESVVQQVPELATLEIDLVRVVGKTVPERVFTIVGDEEVGRDESFQALKASHVEMLAAYRARDWSVAQDALMRCEELDSAFGLHGYYEMFERRIGEYEVRSPSSDWDGVFVAESK